MPSSTEWKFYYQQNAQSLLEIPWHLGAELTPEETIAVCDQILRDEVKHVQFQSEQLSKLRSNRNCFGLIWTMGLQRFLFFGTVFVVWLFHRKVFLRGNFPFRRYWQECWREFNEAFSSQSQ